MLGEASQDIVASAECRMQDVEKACVPRPPPPTPRHVHTPRCCRMLQSVLQHCEAETSAFCRQDESLASDLSLTNGAKTMHLYQRFAVKWMMTREQNRGRPVAAPLPPAPIAAAPAAAAALPAPGAASLRRDVIGHAAQPPRVKIEQTPSEQCIATAYAEALHRRSPADLVNVRTAGCSAHRNPLYRPLPAKLSCGCVQYFWNALTGDVCAADADNFNEPDFSPFGGLLCDHMGLGKASLILFLHFFMAFINQR
jgi:hypothetical protein